MLTYKFEIYHDGNMVLKKEDELKDKFTFNFDLPIIVPNDTDIPDVLLGFEIKPIWQDEIETIWGMSQSGTKKET